MLTCVLCALSALSIAGGASGEDQHQNPRYLPAKPAHEA